VSKNLVFNAFNYYLSFQSTLHWCQIDLELTETEMQIQTQEYNAFNMLSENSTQLDVG